MIFCQMTNIEFSEWLNAQLEKNNLKPIELAHLARIDPGVVTRLLKGERKPKMETLEAIAHALHLPPETVFIAAKAYKPTYTKDDEKDPSLLEWIKLYKDASPEQQEIMLENARFFSSRNAQKR